MTAPWITTYKPGIEGEEPRPEQVRYDVFVATLLKAQSPELMKLHSALGLVEEAGELAGCIKKNVIYNKLLLEHMKEDGKTLITHIIEEAGDVLFYLQAVLNQYNLDFQYVLQYNANKLGTRYAGLTYSDESANLRKDKEKE